MLSHFLGSVTLIQRVIQGLLDVVSVLLAVSLAACSGKVRCQRVGKIKVPIFMKWGKIKSSSELWSSQLILSSWKMLK